MADPLSATGFIVVIIGATASISKTLKRLIQGYHEAPVAIVAFFNEISDLGLVLQGVETRCIGAEVEISLRTVLCSTA
jgi:hypothetical protein